MDKEDRTIHIAMAFDRNYLEPFYVLTTSIFNYHAGENINLHVVAPSLTKSERTSIENFIVGKNSSILFYELDSGTAENFVLGGKWTKAVYYRLFIPLLVPFHVKRLLYLDSDTILNGNLFELYSADLSQYPVGAVYDIYVQTQSLIGIHEKGKYFNSGVLLIDVGRWRDQRVSERAGEYLVTFPDRILFVDQCALNAVLVDNWKRLPEKYNLLYSYIPEGLSWKELERFISDKIIIHFTLQRPWNFLCKNRLQRLYRHYLRLSPVAQSTVQYHDFSWAKVPAYLRIQLLNYYLDVPHIRKLWRKIKTVARRPY